MAYDLELTWENIVGILSGSAGNIERNLYDGLRLYWSWQTFRAGRTNLEIATALGKNELDIAKADSCFAAMKALYDYADNQTPVQSDYFYSMRQFS